MTECQFPAYSFSINANTHWGGGRFNQTIVYRNNHGGSHNYGYEVAMQSWQTDRVSASAVDWGGFLSVDENNLHSNQFAL